MWKIAAAGIAFTLLSGLPETDKRRVSYLSDVGCRIVFWLLSS